MGAKSEFQRVLERHLGLESRSSEHAQTSCQSSNQESFLDQIKFAFGPVGKINLGVAYPKKATPPPSEVKLQLKEKVVFEKIREKRKLTFEQAEALKVFFKYGVQHIDEFSTDEEIKSAYRQLAKRYHPDFNKTGAEDFKIISLAYNKLF